MNKLSNVLLMVTFSLLVSTQAMAAFVMNGTRFIYDENSKNISFGITNNSERLYGGQVWIDNTNQDADAVFMVPFPPFFKLEAKQKQIIRIMKVSNALPNDRESLFWLNVQEIPPKSTNKTGSTLSFAMNTRVKLIYRPESIIKGRKQAEQQLKFERREGQVFVMNPTPYYFAVAKVSQGDVALELSPLSSAELGAFKPFSEVALGELTSVEGMSLDAVNDWGSVKSYVF